MIGSRIVMYAIRKIKLQMSCVVLSNRISSSCGTVAIPLFRKRGRKKSAIATSAMTATTSHTMTDNPAVNASPFNPTICSVERFVSSSDPAITGNVSERPARK